MFPKTTKILVIDDMRTMRMVLKNTLAQMGYTQVEDADDGTTGWAKISEAAAGGKAFNLILCDWNMPNMTGLELLKKVRADSKVHNTPFLLVTAESEKSQIVEAITAGVDHYITKPFTPATVEEKLKAVWAKNSKAA